MSDRLTHAVLVSMLDCDYATGVLTWKVTRGRAVAGARAGYIDTSQGRSGGYRSVEIFGVKHKEHRVVWFHRNGVWPAGLLDHRDTIKHHNWIDNLREATTQINQQNQRLPHKGNLSGYLGVSWCNTRKKWFSQIKDGAGRKRHLGYFADPKDGHVAYVDAKRVLHSGGTL